MRRAAGTGPPDGPGATHPARGRTGAARPRHRERGTRRIGDCPHGTRAWPPSEAPDPGLHRRGSPRPAVNGAAVNRLDTYRVGHHRWVGLIRAHSVLSSFSGVLTD